jgi:hypothetical protein
MAVSPAGYLKSHPATKQEALLKKVEQSATVLSRKEAILSGQFIGNTLKKHENQDTLSLYHFNA